MATTNAQRKWRSKNRLVKSQLNVMARKPVHDYLDSIARKFDLRGKGEAVTFASFVLMALVQRASYEAKTEKLLGAFSEIYHRDRELYSA